VRRLLAILTCVALCGACGSGSASSSGAVSGALSLPATAGGAVETQPVPPRPGKVPFPAHSGADVIRLATLRPPGKVAYDVRVGNGKTYTLELASDDHHALVHQKQDSGEIWIGLDVVRGTVDFSCTAPPAGAPTCKRGDRDGSAAKTASAITRILGNSFIHATFDPVAAASSGVGVGPDTQIGLDVSCLAASAPVDVRLCATRQGYITELSAASSSVLATAVTPTLRAADLDPPAPPQ